MEPFSYPAAFALAMGALSTIISGICGWLLNRVFLEIDRLRQQDEKLALQVSNLQTLMIDREAFNQHVIREEKALNDLREHQGKLLEAIHELKVLVARNHLKEA
jgi:hypothetical protein